jgi:hypothetical protein
VARRYPVTAERLDVSEAVPFADVKPPVSAVADDCLYLQSVVSRLSGLVDVAPRKDGMSISG